MGSNAESASQPDLWGGLYGSLASALIGALVAVLVVYLTNKSQRKSAEESLQQANQSSNEALRAQERLLREELRWTQESSSRTALAGAIAMFLAAAQEYVDLPGPSFQRAQAISRDMERYYFEILLLGETTAPLAQVLRKWSNLLAGLKLNVHLKGTSDDDKAASEDFILTSVQMLSRNLPLWVNGTDTERGAIEATISAERAAVMKYLKIEETEYFAR